MASRYFKWHPRLYFVIKFPITLIVSYILGFTFFHIFLLDKVFNLEPKPDCNS